MFGKVSARDVTPAGLQRSAKAPQAKTATPQQEDDLLVQQTLRNIVDKHKALFTKSHRDSTNNAMMLTIALEGVARVIAQERSDPAIQPAIQQKLFELYRSDLQTQPGTAGNMSRTMQLAQALIKDNPVARYMHKEMRVEEAAKSIQDMARQAGNMNAVKMFGLLNERFQSELASYTRQD